MQDAFVVKKSSAKPLQRFPNRTAHSNSLGPDTSIKLKGGRRSDTQRYQAGSTKHGSGTKQSRGDSAHPKPGRALSSSHSPRSGVKHQERASSTPTQPKRPANQPLRTRSEGGRKRSKKK